MPTKQANNKNVRAKTTAAIGAGPLINSRGAGNSTSVRLSFYGIKVRGHNGFGLFVAVSCGIFKDFSLQARRASE
jgi:hypothetical protein